MTGTFDAKRSDGITDALPGYLFEQRTEICRADVGMSCDIIQAQGVGFKVFPDISKGHGIYPVSYTHLRIALSRLQISFPKDRTPKA